MRFLRLLANVFLPGLLASFSLHAQTSHSFKPTDDSFVRSNRETNRYGNADELRVRRSDSADYNTYLKFSISGLDGAVEDARIKLFVIDEGPEGGEVYSVSNNFSDSGTPWNQGDLDFTNAPALEGTPLDVSESVTSDEVVEFDVSAAVSGNGTYSFALSNDASDVTKYSSVEGVVAPELVVTTGSSSGPGISSFNPTSGPAGTEVTISGSELSGATGVAFDGLPAPSFVIDSASQIRATVPDGATSGPITVVTGLGTVVSSAAFVVGAASSSVTLIPVEDTYVRTARPTGNYGGHDELRVRQPNSEFVATYLKFNVAGLGGNIFSAILRLRVIQDGVDGGNIYQTSNTFNNSSTPWTEDTMTLENAPPEQGVALFSIGPVSVDQVVEIDLSSVIQSEDIYSFVIKNSENDLVTYSSKEGPAPPELILQTGGTAGNENAPTISGFVPGAGSGGTEVTISGTNFVGVSAVNFNGSPASAFTVDSASQVRAFVPVTASTGKIEVTTSNGTGTSASDFTVFAPPLLTSFSPTSGPVGTEVTLSGSNFTTVTQIMFNGTLASFSITNDSRIVATVPDAATTGKLSLTNSVSTSVSSGDFTVTSSPPPQPEPSTLVLNPIADSMTRSNNPEMDYGASPNMRVRNTASAEYVPYLKFQVPAAIGEISRATLKLHVNDEGIDAGAIYGVSNSYSDSNQGWTEEGLRFHNAPEITGPELSSVGAVNVDDIAEWDVSSFVTGPGFYSFAIRNMSSDMISFSSKDGTNPKPELVLEIAGTSTAPFITGFSPVSGPVGTVVTINGGNFAGAISVSFNGTNVFGFSIDSPTQIRAAVPAQATTGRISVVSNEGTATSDDDFVIPAPPTVASFSPVDGPPGTLVTIQGSNLATVNTVLFNGTPAHSLAAISDIELQVQVPTGASTGPVTVSNPAGTATSLSAFTITEPSGPVTLSFTPIDDAFVRSNRETQKYGDAHELRLRETSSADYISYLKFNVSGLTATVHQATLKLLVIDPGGDGGRVFIASDNFSDSNDPWNEKDLIFANAPEISGSAISSVGPVSLGETVEIDVTDAISGNGVVTLALRSKSTDVVIYSSKEGGQAPVLEVRAGEAQSLAPQISAFTPVSGPSGTRVTIIGSNFVSGGPGFDARGTIAIMPLGNSITQGVHGSTDNAGYRNDLAELLDTQGIDYDFVGTNSDGSGFDRDHEGHSGFRADELLAQLSSYLAANPPNLILLHIGTNDISELQTPATTIDEIEDILDLIRSFDSEILTIISSIVPRKDSKNGETTTLNDLIQGLVSQKIGAGYNLVYAAINEAFRVNSNWEDAYMDDNVHPNDTGYAVMAGVWYDAILDALAASQGIQVAFSGVFANDIIIDSETQLRATVPPGASTGPISITNFFGTGQSLGNFVVQSAARVLVLTNPATGETWLPGTTHAISWRSSGNIGRVDLEYSADGGATWEIIADAIPNKGKATWTVPDKQKDKVIVRLSETSNSQTRHETELGLAASYLSLAADLPSLGEMRDAALGMSTKTDKLSQGDLDKDGEVNLYDILSMLDRNIDYGKGPKVDRLERSQNETIEVSLLDIKTVGDSLQIPVKVKTTAEVRGFQAQLQLSSPQAQFVGQSTILNDHDFLVYSYADGNTLNILGYLKKEGGGVWVDGTLLTIKSRVENTTDQTALTITEAFFISSQMKAIPSTLAHHEFEIASVPEEFRLEQNYPNPFNITTRIHFSLPERAEVRLNIYNLRGELVRTLIHETREPGHYKATWDGRNDRGLIVASGIYIYRIQAGAWEDSRRLTLLK